MDVAALDYHLPPEAIAQVPIEPRDAARLLVDRGAHQPPEHRLVSDLTDFLEPGDLLVVNDTRVLPARLHLRKPTGGAAEVLLLERIGPVLDEGGPGHPSSGSRADRTGRDEWEALVRPGRRVPPGTLLWSSGGELLVEVADDLGQGRRRVFVEGKVAEHGEVPLPPYVHERLGDPERYQTVYAREPASVAAPTAGLHLTHSLLDRCEAMGVEVATVELIVGLDTFRPMTTDRVEDHEIHSERYRVPEATWTACASTTGRVVAVGTTVVRALESAASHRGLEGRTDLFITRGYEFKVVDLLLTNFHVPRSTLLALVDAFVGPRWHDLYAAAIEERYRFLSFGDAMLLSRGDR